MAYVYNICLKCASQSQPHSHCMSSLISYSYAESTLLNKIGFDPIPLKINILNASFLAMTQAVEKLKVAPAHLLIDGNRFKSELDIPFTCMVKGDARFMNIAAASVLAKTYRDDIMKDLHQEYPEYGWDKSKGYPTKAHREAIVKYGATPHHRMSFTLTK